MWGKIKQWNNVIVSKNNLKVFIMETSRESKLIVTNSRIMNLWIYEIMKLGIMKTNESCIKITCKKKWIIGEITCEINESSSIEKTI